MHGSWDSTPAWRHLVAEATPHPLKHTAIAWAIETGASITYAAAFMFDHTLRVTRSSPIPDPEEAMS